MFYILDSNFTKVAEITSFYSILWRTLYLSQSGGDFEIQLPLEEYSYINKDYMIYNSNDYQIGIIKTIKKEDIIEDEVKQVITIIGEMGTSILKNRVIYPKISKKGKISSIISDILNENIKNPKQSNRKIDNFYFYYVSSQLENEVVISAKGETVAETIESLCSQVEAGMIVTYRDDLNNLTLNCVIEDDVSDKVVFCKEDNNLANFTYLTSSEKLYTHCVVEGENNVSTTVTNENKKGIFRKEMYLDKTSNSIENISESDYKQQLKDEGTAELLKHTREEATEFDIILNNYEYKKDFSLGSVVTVRYTDLDIDLKVRVLGVLLSIDENGVEEMTLTLGTITKIELKQDEEDDNEEETETESTNISSVATVNTSYIPVYSESYGVDKVVGGILKLSDATFLFNLTSNYYDSEGENTIDRIYYECDEDLLKNETQIGINCSNSTMFLKAPGTQEDGKWYYELSGIYSYFSLSKIITRGSVETEPQVPTIDDSVTYYGMALTIKPILNQWCYYKDTYEALISATPSYNAIVEEEYTVYWSDRNNSSKYPSADDGVFEFIYLEDYKNLLNSKVTIEFGYTGTNTNFFVTEDEYLECDTNEGYAVTSKNLISSGYAKVIYDGAKYELPVDCKIYICTTTQDADGISIKSVENKYASGFKSYKNTNRTNSNNYYISVQEDMTFRCTNGDLETDNYKYTIANSLKQMTGVSIPKTDDLSHAFEDFVPENYNIKEIDGSELEIEKSTDYGYLILMKDERGLYKYSYKETAI